MFHTRVCNRNRKKAMFGFHSASFSRRCVLLSEVTVLRRGSRRTIIQCIFHLQLRCLLLMSDSLCLSGCVCTRQGRRPTATCLWQTWIVFIFPPFPSSDWDLNLCARLYSSHKNKTKQKNNFAIKLQAHGVPLDVETISLLLALLEVKL